MTESKRGRNRALIVSGALAVLALVLLSTPYVWKKVVSYDRKKIVEHLDHAARVTGWSATGLELENGEHLRFPVMARVSFDSPLVLTLLTHGVEVGDDGRVIGLIQVHHWCGNDEIGEHLARVDIGDAIQFLSDDGPEGRAMCDRVGPYGWDVTCYLTFVEWCKKPRADRW